MATGAQVLDSRLSTQTAQEQRALTVVERVEQSAAIQLLDSRATALLELLPDASALSRFRRIVIQALAKNPELLDCTPESVVLSVFEAATQGLEPTGAGGGAHLVPFNTKVSRNPDRWEKRAQLIPDYRGVVQLVTKPRVDPKTGKVVQLSEVLAVEARVVKEGDEFSWTEGSDAAVHHVPAMASDRSTKATTHVYAIARFRAGGYSKPEVLDRAEVERIRKKGGRGEAFSPWATDWDEMARKTAVKRLAKLLPVPPEVRSILAREDEAPDVSPELEAATAAPVGQRKVDRLAQRLATTATAETETLSGDDAPAVPDQSAGEDAVEGTFEEVAEPETEAAGDADLTPGSRLREAIVDTADANAGDKAASPSAVGQLLDGPFKGWDRDLVRDGITALFGAESYTKPRAHEVAAIRTVADSMNPVAFLAAWRELAGVGAA